MDPPPGTLHIRLELFICCCWQKSTLPTDIQRFRAFVPKDGVCGTKKGFMKSCQAFKRLVTTMQEGMNLCQFTCECRDTSVGAYLLAQNSSVLANGDQSTWSICAVWPVSPPSHVMVETAILPVETVIAVSTGRNCDRSLKKFILRHCRSYQNSLYHTLVETGIQ